MNWSTVSQPTGALSRFITKDFLWGGGCTEFMYEGEAVHGHFGIFVVRSQAGIYLVDTGHPAMWEELDRQLDDFLEGKPIDYIFPTHPEVPHAGLLGEWLRKYPKSVVVGDVRDYHLFFPDEARAGRFLDFREGEALDLGDRHLVFYPAIWRDMPTSLWAYDTKSEVLYSSDAFGFLHPHSAGQCDLLMSEQPLPNLELAQFFNTAALHWTQYTDVPATYADIDEIISRTKPKMIAPAHGALIDDVEAVVPFFKESMRSYQPPARR